MHSRHKHQLRRCRRLRVPKRLCRQASKYPTSSTTILHKTKVLLRNLDNRWLKKKNLSWALVPMNYNAP